MTNTRNTPVEVMESTYPVRVKRYELRKDSAGAGQHQGGQGLIREFEFCADTTVTLLTERRAIAPWGLQQGQSAQTGENLINDNIMPAKFCEKLKAGDRLTIKTAGGGGWGKN